MRITAFDKKGSQIVAATVENGRLISLTYHSPGEMLARMLTHPRERYVCEHSHATPKLYSKAQIWHAREIEQLLKDGVQLRVVAESVTSRKLCEFRGQVTDMGFPMPKNWAKWNEKDEAVACALALHAEWVGWHTLGKLSLFDAAYSPLQAAIHEQIAEINKTWEILRNFADWDPLALGDYEGPDRDTFEALACSYNRMCDWLEGGDWRDLPDPDLFQHFMLGGKSPTPKVLREARKRVAAVWYVVFAADGSRLLVGDKPLGVNSTLRHLLGLKEFHRQSGSHRAQLFWHTLRSAVLRAQGRSSVKKYAEFTDGDFMVHRAQKRRFRRLLHDMVSMLAQLSPA